MGRNRVSWEGSSPRDTTTSIHGMYGSEANEQPDIRADGRGGGEGEPHSGTGRGRDAEGSQGLGQSGADGQGNRALPKGV